VLECGQCGASNDPKLTFCRMCGDRLPKAKPAKPAVPKGETQLRCEQCGVASPSEYRFCIGCGAVLPCKREIAPAALAHAMMRSGRRASIRPPAGESDARKQAKIEVAGLPANFVTSNLASPPIRDGEAAETADAPEPLLAPPVVPEVSVEPSLSEEASPPVAEPQDEVGPSLDDAAEASSEGDGRGSPVEGEAHDEPEEEPVPLEPRRDDLAPAEEEPAEEEPAEEEPPVAPVPTRRQVQAQAEPITGRLIVIVEDGSEGASLDLRGTQLDIGREEGDIVLEDDPYLSPRHARLFRHEGEWYLRDLDSLNGVFRRLRDAEPLRHGDRLLLGLEVLRYEALDNAEDGLGQAMQHGVMLFGSPATPRRARLCQRTIEGVTRDVYHLVGDETTLGREIGDIVFTADPFMSRRHALVRWDDALETFVVSDLSSSNGTYLAIREDVRLDDGDFVRLGQHLFRVELPESDEGLR